MRIGIILKREESPPHPPCRLLLPVGEGDGRSLVMGCCWARSSPEKALGHPLGFGKSALLRLGFATAAIRSEQTLLLLRVPNGHGIGSALAADAVVGQNIIGGLDHFGAGKNHGFAMAASDFDGDKFVL